MVCMAGEIKVGGTGRSKEKEQRWRRTGKQGPEKREN